MEVSRLCLTSAELRELSGYKAHRAQCLWLETNQFRFVVDRCGHPKVLRSVINARLGSADTSESTNPSVHSIVAERHVRPDFSALSSAHLRPEIVRRT